MLAHRDCEFNELNSHGVFNVQQLAQIKRTKELLPVE